MSLRPTAAFVTAMLVFLPLRAAALDLHLDNVQTAASPFEFNKITDSADTGISISRDALIASTPSYDLWMEPEGVSAVPQYGYFRYEMYVRPKTSPGQITRVTFFGKTDGGFDDQFAEVHFTIGNGASSEEGDILLPIFGRLPSGAITSDQPADPIPVFLATDKEISVPLTNQLKQMPVRITGASASPNDRSLWKPVEIRGATSGAFTPFLLLNGAPPSPDNLKIWLQPKTPQAFATALIPGKNKEDDVITVLVRYKTLAREEMSSPIRVRVRFEPWPPYLPFVAVIGAVLGWLILLGVRARKEESGDQMRILVAAAVAAFLIEIFGMLLVAGGSELKFLGFPIDPFRLLPATFIGLIAGLAGYQSRDFLLNFAKISFFKLGNTGGGQ
jgi:hypothetical protein